MNPVHIRYVLGAIVSLLLLAGCQRIFEDPGTPRIQVRSPDLSIDQLDPEITLRLEAASDYSSVTRVELGATEMAFDQAEGVWLAPVTLRIGVNQLIVTSYSEDSEPGVDTLFALHMPYSVDPFPGALNTPVGGHTTTLSPSGAVYVIGGAASKTGNATDRGQMLREQALSFTSMPARLHAARVGHTATVLRDGRILIAGGGVRGQITSVSELVESVELYSEETVSFDVVPVVGDPIRRMYHTASFRNTVDGTVLDLVGGTGDIQYAPEPELGVRGDLRSFLLRNDTLFALSPAIGPQVDALTMHTQTSLENLSPGVPGAYYLTGYVAEPVTEPASFILDFASPFGITLERVQPSHNPRIGHAAERLKRNAIGLFGGVSFPSNALVGTSEVFIWPIERYFVLPVDSSHSFFNRYGHTATIVGPNRILVVGGFNEQGTAIEQTLVFNYTL